MGSSWRRRVRGTQSMYVKPKGRVRGPECVMSRLERSGTHASNSRSHTGTHTHTHANIHETRGRRHHEKQSLDSCRRAVATGGKHAQVIHRNAQRFHVHGAFVALPESSRSSAAAAFVAGAGGSVPFARRVPNSVRYLHRKHLEE